MIKFKILTDYDVQRLEDNMNKWLESKPHINILDTETFQALVQAPTIQTTIIIWFEECTKHSEQNIMEGGNDVQCTGATVSE